MSDTQTTPPTKPESESPKTPGPRSGTALKTILVVVSVILLIGAIGAGFYFLPRLLITRQTAPAVATPTDRPTEMPPTTEATATPAVPEILMATTTLPAATSTTATSTPEAAATSTTQAAPASTISFGQTIDMFEDDEVTIGDATRSYRIKAAEFTDSRCPEGVQCIWAGERGIRLEVINLLSQKVEDMRLGMVRTKTAEVMGLNATLIEIDDAKGGTYAKVKFD